MTINERLAVLEEKAERSEEDALRREQYQHQSQQLLLTKIEDLTEKLEEVTSTLTKYKGFVGGIVFLASSLGIFLYKFFVPIYNLFSGRHG